MTCRYPARCMKPELKVEPSFKNDGKEPRTRPGCGCWIGSWTALRCLRWMGWRDEGVAGCMNNWNAAVCGLRSDGSADCSSLLSCLSSASQVQVPNVNSSVITHPDDAAWQRKSSNIQEATQLITEGARVGTEGLSTWSQVVL